MSAQRKVTTFVTRGTGADARLLVFWHAGSGMQVPAGTVEDGETFEDAARREAREETGLSDLTLLARLGSRTRELPVGRAVLSRRVVLQTRPGTEGARTPWSFTNVEVEVAEQRDGYTRVIHTESDLDAGGDGLVHARFEGWVPADALVRRQVREFFHLRASEKAPETWRVVENDRYVFQLSWVPLTPRPPGLVPGMRAWLAEFYDDLRAAVEP